MTESYLRADLLAEPHMHNDYFGGRQFLYPFVPAPSHYVLALVGAICAACLAIRRQFKLAVSLARITLMCCTLALVNLTFVSEGLSLTINIASGRLGDLNGNGSAIDEAKVLATAANIWSNAITTDRVFDLRVFVLNRDGSSLGAANVDNFDVNDIPTGGFIIIDPNPGDQFPGFSWYVDHTNNGFMPVAEFDDNHVRLSRGPHQNQFDLLTLVMHEIGHALGWTFNPDLPTVNPRFSALMNPSPGNFSNGQRVFLEAGSFNVPLAGDGLGTRPTTELGHLAPAGSVDDWNGALMSTPLGLLRNGVLNRVFPGKSDVEMYTHAYEDGVLAEPRTLIECSSDVAVIVGSCDSNRREFELLTDFETGTQGWAIDSTLPVTPGTATRVSTGGNPGGYLRVDDTQSPNVILEIASSSDFSGNLLPFDGGTLSFDAILLDDVLGGASPLERFGLVTITGGGDVATLDLIPGDIAEIWTTYSASLTALTWGKTQSEWENILRNIDSVTLYGEPLGGPAEVFGIDNFRIGAVPEPHSVGLAVSGILLTFVASPIAVRRR